jgi:DNA-binding NarL/FixJ family response regulator
VRPTIDLAGNAGRLDLSVLVVDPRDLVRHGVCLTIQQAGAKKVAHAPTGARAFEVATSLKPDMVIVAARLPDMSGAEATRRVIARVPECQVLVLAGEGEEELVFDALVEGASGHLPTLATPDELVERVRLARMGGIPLSPSIAGKMWERLRTSRGEGPSAAGSDMRSLSAREVEVLRLLATGMDNAGIARALSVSRTTVKKHVSNILVKLHLNNRVQAAVHAVHAGLDVPRALSEPEGASGASDEGERERRSRWR